MNVFWTKIEWLTCWACCDLMLSFRGIKMNINTIKQHFSTSVQSDSDSDYKEEGNATLYWPLPPSPLLTVSGGNHRAIAWKIMIRDMQDKYVNITFFIKGIYYVSYTAGYRYIHLNTWSLSALDKSGTLWLIHWPLPFVVCWSVRIIFRKLSSGQATHWVAPPVFYL